MCKGALLAQRIGAKPVLLVGVLGASATELFVPITAKSFPLLIICRYSAKFPLNSRIFTGLLEGVVIPVYHNLISNWLPASERSTALGIIWSGGTIGTIASLVSNSFIISVTGRICVCYRALWMESCFLYHQCIWCNLERFVAMVCIQ